MTLRERLASILEAMPETGAVTLPVPVLREWLEEEDDDAEGPALSIGGSVVTDLTVEEVAEAFGRTPACIRQWIRQGRLPGAFKIRGRNWMIPRGAVRAFLGVEASGGSDTGVPHHRARGRAVDLGKWRNL